MRFSTLMLALFTLTASSACGDINLRDGTTAGHSYCQDKQGAFHFKVLVPPWKYNKEYKCSQWEGRQCVGTWSATGRYVFVVSDIPFVNFDSEIVASFHVTRVSGATNQQALQLITLEQIGAQGSAASFADDDTYPRPVSYEASGLSGHEVLWRQERSFEGSSYNWYRRDVFLKGAQGQLYYLQLFSIDTLDKPEFDAILETFREGPAPDGAPDCQCKDEHDPKGVQPC